MGSGHIQAAYWNSLLPALIPQTCLGIIQGGFGWRSQHEISAAVLPQAEWGQGELSRTTRADHSYLLVTADQNIQLKYTYHKAKLVSVRVAQSHGNRSSSHSRSWEVDAVWVV